MKNFFLGSNPQTSIAGIILAGLYALQTAIANPPVQWWNVAIVVAIAVLGRLSADSKNAQP